MNVDILARRCFGDGARCVETAASIHSLSLPLMWPCFLSSSPYLLPFSFSFSLALTTCYLTHLTPILSTYAYFRVRFLAFLTVIASLPSPPFYSFASIGFRSAYSLIFVEMLFTERSKNQRKILER